MDIQWIVPGMRQWLRGSEWKCVDTNYLWSECVYIHRAQNNILP